MAFESRRCVYWSIVHFDKQHLKLKTVKTILIFFAFFYSQLCYVETTSIKIRAKVVSISSYQFFHLITVKNVTDNKVYRLFSNREVKRKTIVLPTEEQKEQNPETFLEEGKIYNFCIRAKSVEIAPNAKIGWNPKADFYHDGDLILPKNENSYISVNLKDLKYRKASSECKVE
jgi:hypothetical protein